MQTHIPLIKKNDIDWLCKECGNVRNIDNVFFTSPLVQIVRKLTFEWLSSTIQLFSLHFKLWSEVTATFELLFAHLQCLFVDEPVIDVPVVGRRVNVLIVRLSHCGHRLYCVMCGNWTFNNNNTKWS